MIGKYFHKLYNTLTEQSLKLSNILQTKRMFDGVFFKKKHWITLPILYKAFGRNRKVKAADTLEKWSVDINTNNCTTKNTAVQIYNTQKIPSVAFKSSTEPQTRYDAQELDISLIYGACEGNNVEMYESQKKRPNLAKSGKICHQWYQIVKIYKTETLAQTGSRLKAHFCLRTCPEVCNQRPTEISVYQA